jgi:ElaB/YqjD/DUF883 family membrane-anchored ribosome-binding protein
MVSETPSGAERFKDSAARLLSDWIEVAKAAATEVEQFVKEKPVAGAAAAFVLGWLAGSTFKR